MVIYATKKTIERFNLQTPEDLSCPNCNIAKMIIEKEQREPLLQWGAKIFYFDRRKCLQLVNFASKLTIFLAGMKNEDVSDFGNYIAAALFDLYQDDPQTTKRLEKLFQESPVVCFAPLSNKSIISTLNNTQSDFLWDGYLLYEYLEDGILHSRKINRRFNFDWIVSQTINGKRTAFYPGQRFKELLAEYSPQKPIAQVIPQQMSPHTKLS